MGGGICAWGTGYRAQNNLSSMGQVIAHLYFLKASQKKAPVRIQGPSIEKERLPFLFLYLE